MPISPIEEVYYFKKPVPKKPPFVRLRRVTDSDGEERFLYLGYPLLLSPDEQILLSALEGADPHTFDEEEYLPVSTLLDLMRDLHDKAHPLTDEERLAIFFDKHYTPHARRIPPSRSPFWWVASTARHPPSAGASWCRARATTATD